MNDLEVDLVFNEIDDVMAKAIVTGDPLIALEYGSAIKRAATIRGLGLAKLLYELGQNWHLFQAAGYEGTLEEAADVHLDIRPATTRKYVEMWRNIFANPQVEADTKELLEQRPMGDLLLLTAAVGEGSLAGEDLKEAALAGDRNQLREHIRAVRGERTTSKTAITLCLCMVDKPSMAKGTLYVKQGNKREILGHLVEPESDLAEKGRNALVNGRAIVEVYA